MKSNILTKEALDYCPKSYEDTGSLGYDKRILDAFADLFWFHTDCSSASIYDDKYYLALNSSAGQDVNKKFFNLQNSTLVKPVIDALSSQEPNKLLGARLCSNKNFLEKVIKKVSKKYSPYEEFVILSSNFSAFINVYEKCKSINYIKDWKETKSFEKLIELKSLNNEDIFNKIFNSVSNTLLKIYFSGIKDLLNQQLILDLDVTKSLIRPLQDSYKIMYFLQRLNIKQLDFVPIDVENLKLNNKFFNKEPIHAENALYYYTAGKANYYGTSKLSCHFCHEKLGEKNLNHRGSHYQFDKWGTLDEKDIAIKEKLTTSGAVPLPQERKLSFDDFEKDIIVTLSGDINISKTSIEYINPYFGKYTLDAIDSILQLRLSDLYKSSDIDVLQCLFFDKNNITELVKEIISSDKDVILVPINLFNKHAAGLLFERTKKEV